ncbi:PAS domain-containing sensor histidine kinase [Pseudomonas guariconensis]|uniref:PAS domain-containing sensor histidine kinase n=1 Tax=Pseudomonas guariconensis TaxID=1288410 RepID=UPI0018A92984|nr:PAS domain-containing sensor histidine kinase [Pseudomonas guariconensis]MBF8740580.1 PAS domain-containing protein [Pseudomonas guariconensis]MBF8750807.1 PAS domain-containing protein [Pseudomonas guariconensis]
MTGLFDRWLGTPPPASEPEVPAAVGLQLWLDPQGAVLRLSGPLRTLLALPLKGGGRVHDYLERHSWLVLEGEPADWQGQPLDLDFHTVTGHPLRTRGWLMRQGEGWLLQLFDIGDLLLESAHARQAQEHAQLALEIGRAVRECSEDHLVPCVTEQLQQLAERWQVRALRVLLHEAAGWRSFADNACDWPWPEDARLQPWLSAQRLDGVVAPELLALCGGVSLSLLPFCEGPDIQAWLLCAGGTMPGGEGPNRVWHALAQTLLSRYRLARLQRQAHYLDELQQQLGAGWWAWSAESGLHLDPILASRFELPSQAGLEHWLARLHPADREPAQLALEQARSGADLSLSVRIPQGDEQAVSWFHWVGRWQNRQLQGFLLDISALKAQELQAGAARARLENLIASSPAVIYIQRYAEGALHSEFFSASLMPLLGWAMDSEQARQPGLAVHPQDRPLWLERTRTLLRDGQARCRYRLCDNLGGYHWVLDEARLLRNDLGQPVEVVGLWLDVTEATEAAERVRQSEERYRVLVEDSPAMICRYRPDLGLVFGNRPLADYLQCAPADLVGMNLGQWLSDEQREAFLARLAALTPEHPVSSAEICLQLPGREHAWWVWADRGLFDEQGRLLEIQAVGRDNTEVRRSQRQLFQGAKMATLGELTTGLLHEINQPLNVMRMATANALKRLENGTAEPAYLQDKLHRIETQIERTARLVDHMRVFGRRSEIERQCFVAWGAVAEAAALLQDNLRGKGVELRIEVPDEQPAVLGHQDQLEQVLINLMINARDALLEQRRGEAWISIRQTVQPGELCLWVEDNGGGIDPRLLTRIFEPFFTTKPAGVGTGLGLSVSYGIVEGMGGSLSVVNGAEGACFKVCLPTHITS